MKDPAMAATIRGDGRTIQEFDMSDRTCSQPACNKPYRARGLCASHYNQAFRKPRKVHVVACAGCGTPTEKVEPRKRPVCSQDCRYYITYGRWPWTGKEMVGPVHYRVHPKQGTPKPPATKWRFASGACDWCGQWYMHDRRTTGVLPRYCSPRCSKGAGKARYDTGRLRFAISPMARRAIYQRDEWTCQLCRRPVDPALPPNDQWAASLDHIECQSWTLIPDHSAANLRLAHRICNALRADGADKEPLLAHKG